MARLCVDTASHTKWGCEITQTQITKEVHRLFRVSGPPFVVKFT